MDEEHSPQQFVRIDPNMMRAISAINTAFSVLDNAVYKLKQRDFGGSVEESKIAMRFAASAILFHDGYIASTFESTKDYIEKTYPGRFPLDDWHEAEITITGEGPGLLNMIYRLSGELAEKKKAEKFITSAEKFIGESMKLMGV